MRPTFFSLAVLTLAFLWLTPWSAFGFGPFSGHMIVHMGIVAVAAPLLALSLAGTSLDPVGRAPRLFAPIPVSLGELIVVWIWHTPALHHAARHSLVMSVAEQGCFWLAGLWLWLAAFGDAGEQQASRAAGGVIALLLTSMHMTLLGALFALAPRPLFETGALEATASLSDQHWGGAIMLLVGGISYLAGGLWLTASLLGGTDSAKRQLRPDTSLHGSFERSRTLHKAKSVMPAQAGIQAGLQWKSRNLDSRFRGNDDKWKYYRKSVLKTSRLLAEAWSLIYSKGNHR